ncbi:dipeptide epimerase [Flavobacterium psychrotolerans]|uniref:Dipeptide epimerase n=1 Tax=Flavobacterium psychrotolerans TaxID=2169410 RepID=A0A2U1JQD7_9FLAO|nr:dipeptide epimerase [Flavobacterium psychrotolerans]PWA07194.1 dipeptide epimerase [Flavobacterium psychrotolerans]
MALTLAFHFYDLPLRHPFTISRYTVKIQKTVVVCISDGTFSGYGEATVNPYYHSTVEKLSASLAKVLPIVAITSEIHPKDFWESIAIVLKDDYFALCAVDMAYWDYYARKNMRTLRSYWSDEDSKTPLTSYTIGIDSIAIMQQKIIEMSWPIYKIKLGTPNDIQIVESLRKITDSVFRIDANCAWNANQTIKYASILKELNVEFIEQPLNAGDIEGMKKVKSKSVLPIIADESCQREKDVILCSELFHGINIKLMKCGGITPALRMIEVAKEQDLLLMAGCMTESTVGISGLVQIAPLLDYLDADGALLLSQDIAEGVTFDFGKIVYPNAFGSAVKLYVPKIIKC